MVNYSHRQRGTTLLVVLGGVAAICLAVGAVVPDPIGLTVVIAVAIVMLAVCFLLSSLWVEVTDDTLRWSFGPGLIRKQVPVADISDARVTRVHLWEGWGIHLTMRGWLYNVSGFQAVAVQLKSGKRFMLGSDDAEQLASTLRASAGVSEAERVKLHE